MKRKISKAVRLSDEQLAFIARQCRMRRMTFSDYIRFCIDLAMGKPGR